jgi:hypothetical protein
MEKKCQDEDVTAGGSECFFSAIGGLLLVFKDLCLRRGFLKRFINIKIISQSKI